MTRKCVWAGFSYLAALWLCAAFRSSCNYIFALAAVGFGIVGLAAAKKYRVHILTCLIFFLAGVGYNTLYTKNVYDRLTALDGENVEIVGYVKEFSYVGSDTSKVTVCGRVNGIKTEITFFVPYDDISYYDRIRVEGKVTKLTDSLRFSSESYYYSKGVFLQGGTAQKAEVYGKNACPVLREIKEYRDRMFVKINKVCKGETGAFLSAMMCGDKSEMTEGMKTSLYRSGIGHILAVSGAHLVIVTTFLTAVLMKFIKDRRCVYILTLLETAGFTVFAGFSVSVVRAAVMLAVSNSGFLFRRQSDTANSLGLCGFILTLSCPYSAISASFIMSFAAVFALGVIAPVFEERSGKAAFRTVKNYASAYACTAFFTASLNVMLFGGVSTVSVITNIILLPLCSAALQLCFAGILFGGADIIAVPLFKVAGLVVKPVMSVCRFVSQLSFSYVNFSAFRKGAAVAVCIMSAVVFLSAACKDRRRVFAFASAAVMLLWVIIADLFVIMDSKVAVTVLPNKSGSVYIISYKNNSVMIDLGSKGRLDYAAENYLRRQGTSNIDGIFFEKDQIYSIDRAENDFSLTPRLYFTDKAAEQIYPNAHEFMSGGNADFGYVCVYKNDSGYRLDIGGRDISIDGDNIQLDNKIYDISEEEYPLEIDTENYQIRRLSYGGN